MSAYLKGFFASDDGAVTVDWVVLTAAVVGLVGTVIYSIEGGTGSVSTKISSDIAGISVDSGL